MTTEIIIFCANTPYLLFLKDRHRKGFLNVHTMYLMRIFCFYTTTEAREL